MKRTLYLILCIAGTVLPYSQLLPFLRENGFDLSLFAHQLFANKVSSFFGMDVIVSSFALWIFAYAEGSRLKMRNLWIYVVANLLVGVSLGLPLFLMMRQSRLDQGPGSPNPV